MNYLRGIVAATALTLAGTAHAAPATPPTKTLPSSVAPATKTLPATGTRVNIAVSCLPNATALTLSECKVDKVEPPEFAPVVSENAMKAAQASKLPADWRTSMRLEAGRVILPVTVMARPAPAVNTAPQPGDVIITLSCLPQADFSVTDCRFVKAEPPEMSTLQNIALSTVTSGRLAADWRTRYEVENGRVILPVRLSRRPAQ